MSICFVGAGPGDPDLITVKGKKLLAEADIIIYAGSLVNPKLLDGSKPGTAIYNSAGMTLNEVLEVMIAAEKEDKKIVRLHTGDPSLYGATQEQMDYLREKEIDFEVVPGVSSFLAAGASLKQEFTLPEVSQTVIITRREGRTPVPEKEKLSSLASHNCTLCIFLSVHMISEVVDELKAGGYQEDTPIAIVYKASWPEEKVVKSTLKNIAEKVEEEGVRKTALIIVGDFLRGNYALSKLYDPEFTHEYRHGNSSN